MSILLSFVVFLSSTGMAFANDAAGEATYSNIDILKEVAFNASCIRAQYKVK